MNLWNKDKAITLSYGTFLFLIVSFFLPKKMVSVALLLVALSFVFSLISGAFAFPKLKGLIMYPVLFGLLGAGLLYTDNIVRGIDIQIRHLSFVFVPFATASFCSFSKRQKKSILQVFIISTITAGLYCIGVAGFKYLQTGSIYAGAQTGHFVYNNFMHQKLSSALGLHAIYFSLFVSFSGFVLLYNTIHHWLKMSPWIRVGHLLSLVLCFILILLLKSAVFGVIFPLGCAALVVHRFWSRMQSSKSITLGILLGAIIIVPFMYYAAKSKLDNFSMDYDISRNHLSPLTMRLAIWECTFAVIKDHWLIGVGTGDAQGELMKMYTQKNFQLGQQSGFNAHNMYLQYTLSNGLISCLAFTSILFLGVHRGFKSKNVLAVALLASFALFSITESTLLTIRGIAFFTFFSSLFYWDSHLGLIRGHEDFANP